MRTKLATFLLALILLFSMSIPALAYEVNVTGGYASCPYSFRPHYSFSTTFKDAMGNGAKAWESAGKGVLAQKSTYTNALTTYPKSDGYNNITMISTTADYLAQCSWWTSNNEITEADINFNPAYSWSSNPTSGQYDIHTFSSNDSVLLFLVANDHGSYYIAGVNQGAYFKSVTKSTDAIQYERQNRLGFGPETFMLADMLEYIEN